MENAGKQWKTGGIWKKLKERLKKQGVAKENIGKQWKAEGIGKQRKTDKTLRS